MAYRNDIPPAPDPDDLLPRFFVRNGATMKVTFGCYYAGRGHDPHTHDYMNWPAANAVPEGACQMVPPRDMVRWSDGLVAGSPAHLEPIHLLEEGFNDLATIFDDEDYQSAFDPATDFSEMQDNYIVLTLWANIASFTGKPKEFKFTVYASSQDKIDAVCRGILVILPGPHIEPQPII